MNTEREDRNGRVPLPGFADSPASRGPGAARADGVRRVRRMSNWTLAALVAGTGAATVALAHNAFPSAATSSGTAATAGGATTAGTAGSASTATGPQVNHTVATTSGSGVVTTTTTKTVNGKVVVTHVRHASTHQDN
jgi:hypothetical protein